VTNCERYGAISADTPTGADHDIYHKYLEAVVRRRRPMVLSI
jgi:hypothetical protein